MPIQKAEVYVTLLMIGIFKNHKKLLNKIYPCDKNKRILK